MSTSNQPPQPNGDRPPSQPPAPAAPVFSAYYPRTPSHPSSSATSLKGCCRCVFLLLALLAFLALAVVLAIILSVKPKKPQLNLQLVGVQYMNITADNPTGTTASITLTIRLVFDVVNNNKVGIKYGESRFTIMYGRIPLGKASIPGFFQEAYSTKQVVATIFVDRMSLLQADAADLIRNASLNDRVDFQVLGDVRAKIRVMNFDTPGVQVSVDCAIAISPRKQSLTYKQCAIRN